jgi:hypothetical protein
MNATRWIYLISVLLTVAGCGTALAQQNHLGALQQALDPTQSQPAAAPAKSAAPAVSDSSAPAHFSAAGLNDEDDLVRIYSGAFQSVRLDRGGTAFMLITSSYMEDFARDCKAFLPPNKVEITQQICPGSTQYTYTPDGRHDIYGNPLPTTCVPETVGTGLYADPQLYSAVRIVAAKSSVNLLGNMLGMVTAKGSHAGTPFTLPTQINDQLAAVGTEMETLIHTNACGTPGLRNFQVNLIRFANGENPIKFAGAVTSGLAGSVPGGPIRDADYTRLLNDLVAANARGWVVNRYQPGSISDSIVSHDPQGRPVRIMARYSYADSQGTQRGRVTVTFNDGSPDCIYFSDAPDTCRVPATGVISAYERNAYAKASLPARSTPFVNSCNAFFSDPRTSRFAPPDATGYCQCLSDKYQGVMTPAEDVFYANNFEAKFWRGIAQPTSTDPAWSRLNPVAVSCMQ